MALVVALKNLVGQLGEPFRKAADGVLDRIYDCVTSMPVFVKIDDAAPLDSALLNRMVKAIKEKKRVAFRYAPATGGEEHPVNMEPYRIVYFGGFWYLVGNEPCTGILKRYALDKSTDFRFCGGLCKGSPDDLDAVLRGSANIWFTNVMRVQRKVNQDRGLLSTGRTGTRRCVELRGDPLLDFWLSAVKIRVYIIQATAGPMRCSPKQRKEPPVIRQGPGDSTRMTPALGSIRNIVAVRASGTRLRSITRIFHPQHASLSTSCGCFRPF